MPPGPVKIFTNKIRGRGNKMFKLATDSSELPQGLTNTQLLTLWEQKGLGFHISKIVMFFMLIVSMNSCRLSTTHPLSTRACIDKEAPIEIPSILFEDVEGRGAIEYRQQLKTMRMRMSTIIYRWSYQYDYGPIPRNLLKQGFAGITYARKTRYLSSYQQSPVRRSSSPRIIVLQ